MQSFYGTSIFSEENITGKIDFTNCKKILERAYNGANGKKIAVEYNGREYMLKFSPSGAMKPIELSYTNSCISEHIASSIFNMVGIKVQETLLGNFDRHNGNWSFLFDDFTKEASLAPIYDCGSCLLPQADERIKEQALINEDVMNARIYQFPSSTIKLDGRKINYSDFLMSAEESECNAAVQRMVPKINLEQIKGFIDEVPYITELQKNFYMRYITARFEQILKSAYDMVMSEKQELSETSEPNMTM